MPCPFLGGDNLCSFYDVRPSLSRIPPHTSQEKLSDQPSDHQEYPYLPGSLFYL